MRNIEIKARAKDWEGIKTAALELSDGTEGKTLHQTDIFYRAEQRLKLRTVTEAGEEKAVLIGYSRADESGPKTSEFFLYPTQDSTALHAALARGCGVRGIVKKTRLLHLIGQTRVHLDDVEGLGQFVELEVVLREEQTPEEGRTIADDLMGRLGIATDDLESLAYIDLLEQAARGQ